MATKYGGLKVSKTRCLKDLEQVCERQSELTKDPEFTATALNQWAYQNGVELKLIQLGKPMQKDYIESLNGNSG